MTENREAEFDRRYFLGLALLMLFVAVLIYLVLGNIAYAGADSLVMTFQTVLALLLLLAVAAALFFLLCYGNRRIGRATARRLHYARDAWGVPMRFLGFGGFRAESASDEKKLASQRLKRRHERRRYARKSRPGEQG